MLILLRRQWRFFVCRSRSASDKCSLCHAQAANGPGTHYTTLTRRKTTDTRHMSARKELTLPSKRTIEEHFGPLSTGPTVPAAKPLVVIISGPSGVGKDAVIKSLREARPDLTFVVTATSRPQRPGEVHGKDYFFVSKQQFENWLDKGDLLEHALVYGDYKGIPRAQVEEALNNGTDVVLRVDVQGAKTIRKLLPEALCIFLVAQSECELVERLVARKTEPLDKLLVRIKTARSELEHLPLFDYVVVNKEGRLPDTVKSISGIIEAEKLRVVRTY